MGSNNIITILDLYDTSKGDRSESHERTVSISYKSMVNAVDLILHKVYLLSSDPGNNSIRFTLPFNSSASDAVKTILSIAFQLL